MIALEHAVTVCASCLRASCWQGIFYCDRFRASGTVEKTVSELGALNLEDRSYYAVPCEYCLAELCRPGCLHLEPGPEFNPDEKMLRCARACEHCDGGYKARA